MKRRHPGCFLSPRAAADAEAQGLPAHPRLQAGKLGLQLQQRSLEPVGVGVTSQRLPVPRTGPACLPAASMLHKPVRGAGAAG